MAVFLKQKENSWSSGHSASFLTSLPLQPYGNRNPVDCRNEYDEKGIESTAEQAGHDTYWQINWFGVSIRLLCTL
jgi:hypothetical protein